MIAPWASVTGTLASAWTMARTMTSPPPQDAAADAVTDMLHARRAGDVSTHHREIAPQSAYLRRRRREHAPKDDAVAEDPNHLVRPGRGIDPVEQVARRNPVY